MALVSMVPNGELFLVAMTIKPQTGGIQVDSVGHSSDSSGGFLIFFFFSTNFQTAMQNILNQHMWAVLYKSTRILMISWYGDP